MNRAGEGMIDDLTVTEQLRELTDTCTSLRDWAQQRRVAAQRLRHEAAQMRARTAATRLTMASRRSADVDVESLRRRLTAAERRAGNLEAALASNRRIGVAIGILMARHRLTDVQAFDLMRESSNRRNVKLAAVAEEVVYTGELGSRPAAPVTRAPARPRGQRSSSGHVRGVQQRDVAAS